MRNKVPQVTFVFWIVKIAATTLGETGGDAMSMTLNLGYAVSTAIFFAFFVASATAQIASSKLHCFLYWAAIVATTTVGTTTSDYLMRTAGLGYLWTSLIFFAGVLMVLGIWYFALGLGECESHHPSQSESLLLAGDSHLQYAWHRAWRLFSRYIRAWLRRRRSCVWRHAGPDRGAIFLHEHLLMSPCSGPPSFSRALSALPWAIF